MLPLNQIPPSTMLSAHRVVDFLRSRAEPAAFSGGDREREAVAVASELLLRAFDVLSRRGESWAAPMSSDPIAFLLDSMSDAANLWSKEGALLYRNRASLARGRGVPAAPSDTSDLEAFEVDGSRYERRCLRCHMRGSRYVLEIIRELSDTDDTLSTVAHELRGRLNVLALSSDGLLSAANAHDTELPRAWLRDRLQRLDRALHSLRELLEQLLEVQRSTTRAPVELRALVLDVLQADSEALRAARCRCELVAATAITGAWDALQLRVAIGNLISNALKFGAGRPIAINVWACDANAYVRVADQGSGVLPEDCERIFERFERGECSSASAPVQGWGLGLWLVRNIARAHGGDVMIQSVPGKGAAFTLSLPRERASAASCE